MTTRARPAVVERTARERILDAACDMIAEGGIDHVRIARIAAAAGVSPALVHYHFDTREALLAEATAHSFDLIGDLPETHAEAAGWTAGERLAWMIASCLPDPGVGERDWKLWIELWVRAVRGPELRPVAAQLYERYHAWFAATVEAGIEAGEFDPVDVDVVVGRLIASIDGMGLRALLRDPAMDLDRARREILAGTARDLGVPPSALEVPRS